MKMIVMVRMVVKVIARIIDIDGDCDTGGGESSMGKSEASTKGRC